MESFDGAFFKGKDVAVLGHNTEAADEALFLTRYARTVYLVTPKPAIEAPKDLLDELLTRPQVKPLFGRRALAVVGDGSVRGLTLEPDETLSLQGVFVFTQGNRPIVDYLQGQTETTGNGCLVTNDHMETPVKGVFACGDVLCNAVQQAVVAAAQGCIAALSADRFLNKRKAFARDYR